MGVQGSRSHSHLPLSAPIRCAPHSCSSQLRTTTASVPQPKICAANSWMQVVWRQPPRRSWRSARVKVHVHLLWELWSGVCISRPLVWNSEGSVFGHGLRLQTSSLLVYSCGPDVLHECGVRKILNSDFHLHCMR